MKIIAITTILSFASIFLLGLTYLTATEFHIAFPVSTYRVLNWILGTSFALIFSLTLLIYCWRQQYVWCAIILLAFTVTPQILAAILTYKWGFKQMSEMDGYDESIEMDVRQILATGNLKVLNRLLAQETLFTDSQRKRITLTLKQAVAESVQESGITSTLLKKRYFLDPNFGGNSNASFEAKLYALALSKSPGSPDRLDFCERQNHRTLVRIAQIGVEAWRAEVEKENRTFAEIFFDVLALRLDSDKPWDDLTQKLESLRGNSQPSQTLGSPLLYAICLIKRKDEDDARGEQQERDGLKMPTRIFNQFVETMKKQGFDFTDSELNDSSLENYLKSKKSP